MIPLMTIMIDHDVNDNVDHDYNDDHDVDLVDIISNWECSDILDEGRTQS